MINKHKQQFISLTRHHFDQTLQQSQYVVTANYYVDSQYASTDTYKAANVMHILDIILPEVHDCALSRLGRKRYTGTTRWGDDSIELSMYTPKRNVTVIIKLQGV